MYNGGNSCILYSGEEGMVKTTRNDVARLAEVSPATVSHVINNTKPVSEDLRIRVEQAIETLNYIPNSIARSMKTNRSMQVGLVLSNMENPIYAEFVKGFEATAALYAYTVNICTGYEDTREYFNKIILNRWDGVLIEPLPRQLKTGIIEQLLDKQIKVVLYNDTGFRDPRCSFLRNDYLGGVQDTMDHLLSLGHRAIAYVTGLSPDVGSSEARYAAYERICAERQLTPIIIQSPEATAMTLRSGYEMGPQVFAQLETFTACICTNDLLAMGIATYLKEQQVQIPRDISIAGIDDNIYCDYFTPRLTSIHVDNYEMGSLAFNILYHDIQHHSAQDRLIPMKLVIRESTAQKRDTL